MLLYSKNLSYSKRKHDENKLDKCSKWSMSMKKTYSEDKKLFLDNLTILLSSKLSPLADSWPILQEKTKSTTSAPITETWNEQTHSCSRQQHNVKARCRRKQSSIKRLRNESGWSNGSSLKKKEKKRKHGPRKIMALEQFIREMNWPRWNRKSLIGQILFKIHDFRACL